ncbi:hypothetical protein BGZ63DRAFT_377907, partial [Mariannaea sp. PMI_226]
MKDNCWFVQLCELAHCLALLFFSPPSLPFFLVSSLSSSLSAPARDGVLANPLFRYCVFTRQRCSEPTNPCKKSAFSRAIELPARILAQQLPAWIESQPPLLPYYRARAPIKIFFSCTHLAHNPSLQSDPVRKSPCLSFSPLPVPMPFFQDPAVVRVRFPIRTYQHPVSIIRLSPAHNRSASRWT